MSGIHVTQGNTHGAYAHHGPRSSAGDRPLPTPEARTTPRARTRIVVALSAVVALMALDAVAPTATVALLLAVLTAGVVIGGALRLTDRRSGSETAFPRRGGASRRLDRAADGIAARLRFAIDAALARDTPDTLN